MNGDRPVYDLLPVVHRIRDAEQGYPLRALLEVVEEQWRRLDADLDQLYDNWFIETCAEWVVPYLGDLLGVSGVRPLPDGVASQRAFVANTLRYRRRKGTVAVLEQVARDVTGWPARVVEYLPVLATTQHLAHVRPGVRTVELRGAEHLELVDTPFDTEAHRVDVRHIDSGRGRHNIPHLGVHLWRLTTYPVSGGDARAVDAGRGGWTFDPAGRDVSLFRPPRTETEVTQLAGEVNVPGPVRRRELLRLLAEAPGGTDPVAGIRVFLDGTPVALRCCDLTDWRRPTGGAADPPVAVDPVLGRLTLRAGLNPARVQVDFGYGHPGDVGAGPYDRRATTETALASSGTSWPAAGWQVGVSRDAEPVPGQVVRTIGEALRLWDARHEAEPGQVGVITIMDSGTYREDLTVVIPPGNRLILLAAAWPARIVAGVPVREPGVFVAAGGRPHLVGRITVTGTPDSASAASELVLGGLSVEGGLRVAAGELTSLVVANSTLLAGPAPAADDGWLTATGNPHLTVRLLRTVCAGVRSADLPGLGLVDSIAYAGGAAAAAGGADGAADGAVVALDVPAAAADIQTSTVLGRARLRSLVASNTILRGPVAVSHRQQGYARFSYLPLESRAPRRYRCQPEAGAATPIAPSFTSVDPAQPGFGQLAAGCPVEISTGADDGGELGAYHFLQQNRRVANLRAQFPHYLRCGLEAGVFFAT